jgi:hypothetical protein
MIGSAEFVNRATDKKKVSKKMLHLDCAGRIFAVVLPPRLRNFFREARKSAAVLCLFLVLAVEAMSVFPALHTFVHPDASDPSHQCAVTLFLHGQVHVSAANVAPARSAPAFAAEPLFATAVFSSADVRLLPCRGPPALQTVT